MEKQYDTGTVWGLGLISILGAVAVYVFTAPFGLGLMSDSIVYLQAAKYLALGQGVSAFNNAAELSPMTSLAPGFPFVLSWAWFLGASFADWARSLNILAAALSIFLSGWLVFYVTRERVAALLMAGLLTVSVPFLQAHGRLSAEPLFILSLLVFVCSLVVFNGTGRLGMFYTAVVSSVALTSFSYLGALVIVGGIGWIWLRARKDGFPQRPALFTMLVLLFPVFLWLRHSLAGGNWRGFFPAEVLSWLLPVDVLAVMVLGICVPRIMAAKDLRRKKIFLGLCAGLFIWSLVCSAQLAGAFFTRGYGYTAKDVSSSKIVETLRSVDDRVPLYSNDPQAIYYFSGRPAIRIPGNGEDDRYFPSQGSVLNDFRTRRAAAVIFGVKNFVPGSTWSAIAHSEGFGVLAEDKVARIDGIRKK
ncbi:MAG: hypothetical protein HQL22_11330 [Candidatus Omnitrophica bacterium]|nr:hypothetical protein [Candidatus Omnitrophota bacterium]